MSIELYSHPEIPLRTHLINVYETGMNIFKQNHLFGEYEIILKWILLLHDAGKSTVYFQKKLGGDEKQKAILSRHSEISALLVYYVLAKQQSLPADAYIAYLAVRFHHSDLSDLCTMCTIETKQSYLDKIAQAIDYSYLQEVVQAIVPSTVDLFTGFMEAIPKMREDLFINHKSQFRSDSPQSYIVLQYLFSILLFADKGEAIFSREVDTQISSFWKSNWIDRTVQKLNKNESLIDNIRMKAYKQASENIDLTRRILSIHLPTGAGKTLTTLHTAIKMKEMNPTIQRIIYCLPYMSIIDQNAQVFEGIGQEATGRTVDTSELLKHHHLVPIRYEKQSETLAIGGSLFFIECWQSEIVVTTFYQFLSTLLTHKNTNIKRFHTLAHSIILLDEVQTIPTKYWQLVHDMLLYIAEAMDIRVILVTATMPLLFSEEGQEIKPLITEVKKWFGALNRIEIDLRYFHKDRKLTIEDMASIVEMQYHENSQKSYLLIVNTIKASLELYSLLKDKVAEDSLIYLSTNLIPKERLKRISAIKSDARGKIVISTQLVEAGVDIDMDVVYRDFAPLDSIFQSCGRCNRNQQRGISTVYLFRLYNANLQSYAHFIYDEVLLSATEGIFLDKEVVSESSFLSLADEYYKEIKRRKSSTESEEIFYNLKRLNFSQAFDQPEQKGAFRLIDDADTMPIYVEYDKEASELLQRYESISETDWEDKFARMYAMKELTRQMSTYIINVKRKQGTEKGFYIIRKEMLETEYDTKTGYKRDPEIKDYIL